VARRNAGQKPNPKSETRPKIERRDPKVQARDATIRHFGLFAPGTNTGITGRGVMRAFRQRFRLAIHTVNAHLRLSWPAGAAPLRRHVATDLSPPASWTLVTDIPTSGDHSRLPVLPIGAANRFYRLPGP
jgi:hypothetical protein